MKKSILTGAIALSLSAAATSASALTIDMTSMVFGSTSAVSGVADTDNLGTTFNGTFFGTPWVATTMAAYTTEGAHTWAGIDPNQGGYSYNFTLAATEVAFGAYFDWSTSSTIPVLAIMDCGDQSNGTACIGRGVPMQTGPFPGQEPSFNGVVSAVPVPAAVWLFGSGLLGLLGVARRRKAA